MARPLKPKFPFLTPVIWQPAPKNVTGSGKPLIGKLMFWLGEIPDADGGSSGHCAVIHDNKIITMLHTPDFRKATDKEF